MLDPRLKADWIAALRSGEYQQCQQALKIGNGYCCIGVAAHVWGYKIDEDRDVVLRPDGSSDVPDFRNNDYGALDSVLPNRSILIQMNDAGKSFAEIADYIERTL